TSSIPLSDISTPPSTPTHSDYKPPHTPPPPIENQDVNMYLHASVPQLQRLITPSPQPIHDDIKYNDLSYDSPTDLPSQYPSPSRPIRLSSGSKTASLQPVYPIPSRPTHIGERTPTDNESGELTPKYPIPTHTHESPLTPTPPTHPTIPPIDYSTPLIVNGQTRYQTRYVKRKGKFISQPTPIPRYRLMSYFDENNQLQVTTLDLQKSPDPLSPYHPHFITNLRNMIHPSTENPPTDNPTHESPISETPLAEISVPPAPSQLFTLYNRDKLDLVNDQDNLLSDNDSKHRFTNNYNQNIIDAIDENAQFSPSIACESKSDHDDEIMQQIHAHNRHMADLYRDSDSNTSNDSNILNDPSDSTPSNDSNDDEK
ncbi:MAG: hypothetical protein ACPGII_10885, partial [Opitutales bacterium]